MTLPWNLDYWKSGEWQVVNERLKDMEKKHVAYNPIRRNLFRALVDCPLEHVQVAILGQDPYPNAGFATGRAFDIPDSVSVEEFPPTLNQIYREYEKDLSYPTPNNGNLQKWIDQGILLWNAIPSCTEGRSLSHDWGEYHFLTREIVQRLAKRGIVFCFLGSVARRYEEFADDTVNEVIVTSHPSPRGNLNSKTPFTGSRIFSTINAKLIHLGREPIDWKLP